MNVNQMMREVPVKMMDSGLLKCRACGDIRVVLLKENSPEQRKWLTALGESFYRKVEAAHERAKTPEDMKEADLLFEQACIAKRAKTYWFNDFAEPERLGYWFVAKDITAALGFKNYMKALDTYLNTMDIRLYPVMDRRRRRQKTLLINRAALRILAGASGTTSAMDFLRGVEQCFKGEQLPKMKAIPGIKADCRGGVFRCPHLYPNPTFAEQAVFKNKEAFENKALFIDKPEKSLAALFFQKMLKEWDELLEKLEKSENHRLPCKRMPILEEKNTALKDEVEVTKNACCRMV